MNAANINHYWTSFNEFTTDIRKLYLIASDSQNYADVPPLKLKIKELQELANTSTGILPVYDIKRSQHEINLLQGECNVLEKQLQPRQKFRFSDYTMTHFILNAGDASTTATANSTETDAEAAQAAQDAALAQAQARAKVLEMAGSYTISDKTGAVVTLTTEDMWNSKNSSSSSSSRTRDNNIQLLVSNCDNVVVSVMGVLGSVRIENCKNCYLFLGPCSTSCYIESVTGSIVCCSSHQLRIHNTHDSVLYVRTNGHPIIEDCSYLGFAQYALLQYSRPREEGDVNAPSATGATGASGAITVTGSNGLVDNDDNNNDVAATAATDVVTLTEDVRTAGLETAECWSNVVDFKWHKETQSPNFYLISHSIPSHVRHVLCDNNTDKLPNEQIFNHRPAVAGGSIGGGLSLQSASASASANSTPIVMLPPSWRISVEHPNAPGSSREQAAVRAPTGTTTGTTTVPTAAAVPTVSATELERVPKVEDEDEDEI